MVVVGCTYGHECHVRSVCGALEGRRYGGRHLGSRGESQESFHDRFKFRIGR
jgi:hypothetical protein